MFGKCLKWVFQVFFRRFPVGRDSLEGKKIIKVKFLWIIAAAAGRFYEWESVFLVYWVCLLILNKFFYWFYWFWISLLQ